MSPGLHGAYVPLFASYINLREIVRRGLSPLLDELCVSFGVGGLPSSGPKILGCRASCSGTANVLLGAVRAGTPSTRGSS